MNDPELVNTPVTHCTYADEHSIKTYAAGVNKATFVNAPTIRMNLSLFFKNIV